MNNGIGPEKTREDHRQLVNQLYPCYATARDIRRLVAIVDEDSLTEVDQKYLKFAEQFESHMIDQGDQNRSIEETLDLGWKLLSIFPKLVNRLPAAPVKILCAVLRILLVPGKLIPLPVMTRIMS